MCLISAQKEIMSSSCCYSCAQSENEKVWKSPSSGNTRYCCDMFDTSENCSLCTNNAIIGDNSYESHLFCEPLNQWENLKFESKFEDPSVVSITGLDQGKAWIVKIWNTDQSDQIYFTKFTMTGAKVAIFSQNSGNPQGENFELERELDDSFRSAFYLEAQADDPLYMVVDILSPQHEIHFNFKGVTSRSFLSWNFLAILIALLLISSIALLVYVKTPKWRFWKCKEKGEKYIKIQVDSESLVTDDENVPEAILISPEEFSSDSEFSRRFENPDTLSIHPEEIERMSQQRYEEKTN